MEGILKAIIAGGGTLFTWLFGGWSVALGILLVFMVADIITGVSKGIHTGKLKSAIGYKGFLKKANMMVVIILANMLDMLVNAGVPAFRTVAIWFYIGNEGLSIIENLGAIGVPMPNKVKKAIEALQNEDNVPPNK